MQSSVFQKASSEPFHFLEGAALELDFDLSGGKEPFLCFWPLFQMSLQAFLDAHAKKKVVFNRRIVGRYICPPLFWVL